MCVCPHIIRTFYFKPNSANQILETVHFIMNYIYSNLYLVQRYLIVPLTLTSSANYTAPDWSLVTLLSRPGIRFDPSFFELN